mmetsp:Transcript_10721/g.44312  ORF Transcript_10721/g.44312 Transcript_10721/m.44312 type:complete len:336 (+) Transcript_10721:149-1156(+)
MSAAPSNNTKASASPPLATLPKQPRSPARVVRWKASGDCPAATSSTTRSVARRIVSSRSSASRGGSTCSSSTRAGSARQPLPGAREPSICRNCALCTGLRSSMRLKKRTMRTCTSAVKKGTPRSAAAAGRCDGFAERASRRSRRGPASTPANAPRVPIDSTSLLYASMSCPHRSSGERASSSCSRAATEKTSAAGVGAAPLTTSGAVYASSGAVGSACARELDASPPPNPLASKPLSSSHRKCCAPAAPIPPTPGGRASTPPSPPSTLLWACSKPQSFHWPPVVTTTLSGDTAACANAVPCRNAIVSSSCMAPTLASTGLSSTSLSVLGTRARLS